MPRRVIVVGSAPRPTRGPLQPWITRWGQDRFIEASDVVVRVNNAKNYGVRGAGKRTDILVVRNHGQSGEWNAVARPCLQGRPGRPRELVFTHDPTRYTRDPDHSAAIVAGHGWDELPRTFLDWGLVLDVERRLQALSGRRRAVMPTAGMLAIEYVVRSARFAGWQRCIAGFGFGGEWAGHAFKAERELVRHYMQEGLVAPAGARAPAA